MRTEQEMMDLIIHTAESDERVRAVYMNGSRTNPNVSPDIFQDYDIVYVVRETLSFQKDRAFIDRFGSRLYMQYPEDECTASQRASCYGWLMQFSDGNRLDLHVHTVSYALEHIGEDRLCRILMDKDHLLPHMPPSDDSDHWVKRPDEALFHFCCNEFWWCLNNVAKGLWREEIPYVQDQLNFVLRPQLLLLLSWKIGCRTEFSVSIGKSGKYMDRYLTEEEWTAFLSTYGAGTIESLWQAVISMCALFHGSAGETAALLNYRYDESEALASQAHLNHVRLLPRWAKEIYEGNEIYAME